MGVSVDRYLFTVTDFHHLPPAGLPRRTAAQYLARGLPCERFTAALASRTSCITRGRGGWLDLPRGGLSPPILCQLSWRTRVMGHNGGLVVEGDVVVRILPAGRGRRRAALEVGCRVIGERADEALLHLGVVDEQLAVIIDELDVVGVHEGEEGVERVRGIDAHWHADAVVAFAGLATQRGLRLVAPERPIVLPTLRNVAFLVAGGLQHIDPIFDVHGLLLERECVIGLLFGLVVVEERG